ncbi:TPA: oxidoreductase [Xanthomonas vasicola pv. zeae]|uniref:Oxidoreductase n=2 Tax=Xanthomonas vasicola pv. vasculorum TaxID=325776 RepID=A0A836P6E0_XANVA|nr:oxidoreductase [Xanthomonas vasicola]AVQ05866.1 oxidoreductase [Xanthomonas vasicola pv. vasculorum]AZM70065.1 oxidoreductase [Xanthomonas vasicola pv. vasculorum]AZR28010.1 oxidoreductase [Xanthomonas vasicola pv. arecae]AZR29772.1 oxidoreductase [Xanthomonas vasicola pv. musacearum NCPPB 4379]KEZ98572.1 oxidoreductase [Xanthomonas vasicola pv. vasculorum NCPPB 895]
MPKPFNLAVVGYGYVGRTFHAPLIASTPGLQLHSVVSSKPQQPQADFPGINVLADLDSALADPALDAVVLATPNQTHAPFALQALAAGKHVLVDKPFALDVAQAQQMVDAANAAGRIISVFQNRRWDADFLTVRRLIEEGQLGEVVEFHSHFDRYRPQVRDRWRESDSPGAGLWYDLGPHVLDQSLQLFGVPQGISADLQRQRDQARSVDYFHVTLHYPRLRVILHAGSLVADGSLRFAVHGTRGSYLKHGMDTQEDQLRAGRRPGTVGWGVDPLAGTLTRVDDEGRVHTHQPDNLPGDYRQYYTAFRDALAGTGPAPVSGSDAVQLMQLVELAQRSAADGKVQWLDAARGL